MDTKEIAVFENALAHAVGQLRGNLDAESVMEIDRVADIIRKLSSHKEASFYAIPIMAEIVIATYDRMIAEEQYAEKLEEENAKAYWLEVLENLTK